MNIVKPNAVVIETTSKLPYEMIEYAGRTCYKSHENISEGSAAKFVSAMYKSNHHAMLEHAHIMIKLNPIGIATLCDVMFHAGKAYHINLFKYLNITNQPNLHLVSGSFRAFIDVLNYITSSKIGKMISNLLNAKYPEVFDAFFDEFDEISEVELSVVDWRDVDTLVAYAVESPSEIKAILMHHIPLTAIFTCDLLIQREFVRHRPASYAGESTRYCNYSKDKFGNEISVMHPCDFEEDSKLYEIWQDACNKAESAYFDLILAGARPEQARRVLPVSTKSELVVTCTEEEWQHIIDLRYHHTTGKAHPDMHEVMKIAYPELCKLSKNRLN